MATEIEAILLKGSGASEAPIDLARVLLKAKVQEVSPMSPNDDDRTPTMPDPMPRQGPRIPHLVVLNGPRVGSAYRLTRPEMIVGRDLDADICLPHPTVSRRHARLIIAGDRVLVEDLGSTNGTFVGVDRVKRPTVVRDADNIAFGIFTLFKLSQSSALDEGLQSDGPGVASGRGGEIGTREYLLDLLQAEYAYARRHGSPLTLVFFRADPVAKMSRGKDAEELVQGSIGRIAAAIDRETRIEDFLARSAQDELVVLVRGDGAAAENMAERARARVEAHTEFPENALAWQTVTAVVLPIEPRAATATPSTRPAPSQSAKEILAAARGVTSPSMREVSNRVVRLRPLVI